MVDVKTKFIVGFLLVTILVSITYVQLGKDVKIRVDKDKTTIYVYENRWVVGAREYNSLFDGTSKMNRRLSSLNVSTIIDDIEKTTTIIRRTGYIRGPVIVDTYFFDGKINDIERTPVFHKIEIFNASGFFFRYEVRDLTYSGLAYALNGETILNFGRNIKIELNPGYRWARVYKSGIVKAQYDINSDYEVFYFVLVDPPPTLTLTIEGNVNNITLELGSKVNITGTST